MIRECPNCHKDFDWFPQIHSWCEHYGTDWAEFAMVMINCDHCGEYAGEIALEEGIIETEEVEDQMGHKVKVPTSEPETVTCAAIRVGDQIFYGKRHSDCIFLANRINGEPPRERIEGFLTDMGRFVDREEAMDIAIKAKQVSRDHSGTRLFSEDLY